VVRYPFLGGGGKRICVVVKGGGRYQKKETGVGHEGNCEGSNILQETKDLGGESGRKTKHETCKGIRKRQTKEKKKQKKKEKKKNQRKKKKKKRKKKRRREKQ